MASKKSCQQSTNLRKHLMLTSRFMFEQDNLKFNYEDQEYSVSIGHLWHHLNGMSGLQQKLKTSFRVNLLL